MHLRNPRIGDTCQSQSVKTVGDNVATSSATSGSRLVYYRESRVSRVQSQPEPGWGSACCASTEYLEGLELASVCWEEGIH